jgi:hypothetical protein
LIVLTGLVLFMMPELLIPVWPWTLTPFTARVIGSWFVLPGLVDIAIAVNRRWRSVKLVVQSQLVGLALILIGFIRGLGDLQMENPLSWSFIVGISLLALGLLLVYLLRGRKSQVGEMRTSRR